MKKNFGEEKRPIQIDPISDEYYINIPEELRYLFPKIIKYDSKNYEWYQMKKIFGVPFSKLYLSEELSELHLDILIEKINILHEWKSSNEEENMIDSRLDIYHNYYNKISERYIKYSEYYQHFPDHYNTFLEISRDLKNYQDNKLGKIGIIHGDPVFTNIIIDNKNNIKFIDMRGKQGELITIYGDIYYDYAKIYQSLIGYDEILNDGNIKLIFGSTLN